MIDYSDVDQDFKGYYVAALTDEYRVGIWPIEDGFDIHISEEKLIELRVFNEDVEYKWFRGNIGEKFHYRKLEDNDDCSRLYEEPIEEYQILDIDFGNNQDYKMPGFVKMSKGGQFYLPISTNSISVGDKPCVKVKYYVSKNNEDDAATIHAHVKEWRLAGFEVK